MTDQMLHGRILPMNKSIQKRNVKAGARFFVPEKLASGADVRLPADTAHHAARTLRLQVGDPIVLFDGLGGEYQATICRIDRNNVVAKTGPFEQRDVECPIHLMLGQGMSSGERMDFTIQKAVELGISGVQPLATARSVIKLNPERAERKTLHWRKLAIAACEQSGRNRPPDVESPSQLSDWLGAMSREPQPGELRLLLSPRAQLRIGDLPGSVESVVLLAGPEGGLTEDEVGLAQRRGFRPVRIGPRVLRTETAALAALSAILLRWGDF